MLFDDADMDFEYIRYTYDEWPAIKHKLILEGHRMPTLPYLITKENKFYGTTVPLIRFICKKLNKYIPKFAEDEYLADAYSDLYNDWMSKWAEVWLNEDPKVKNHYETAYCDAQLANWHNILGDRDGPYIFGDEVCCKTHWINLHITDTFKCNLTDFLHGLSTVSAPQSL